jgi:hypothetical protein
MIEAGLVDLEQVFLPYARIGHTFYELMRDRKFQPAPRIRSWEHDFTDGNNYSAATCFWASHDLDSAQ